MKQIKCYSSYVNYLNARSLHKHINVRHDLNLTSTDINIFSETRCMRSDNDVMYEISGYTLFRNDSHSLTSRPFGGMAVLVELNFYLGIHIVIILMELR